MWWPYASDSWYLFDPLDAQEKVTYYDVGYVPSLRYEGKAILDPSDPSGLWTYDWLRSTFDSLLAIPSPIRINLSQYPSKDWDSVYVSFDIVAVDSIKAATPLVYLAVTEESHRYPYPEGKWRYALRQFVPGPDGYPITLEKGDSLHFDWAYPINAVYNKDAIITTVYVQKQASKAVLQTRSAKVVDMASVTPGDNQVEVWLGQNAPNPFTLSTRIAYQLGTAGNVRLSVYGPTGQLVANLVNDHVGPGSYSVTWDGRDRAGHQVGSGMYYYRLDAGGVSRTGRMVLLK